MPYEKSIIDGPIREFINNKQKEYNQVVPNIILRDDVFTLLSQYARILYYPSSDAKLDGFHVSRHINGKETHFVYINTNKEIESQVFTAAHELGHIWQIDSWLFENKILNPKEITPAENEAIIDHFAAELLMEVNTFTEDARNRFEDIMKLQKANSSINVLIQVAVSLMDKYMVPFKSVLFRLVELEIITFHGDIATFCKRKEVKATVDYYKIKLGSNRLSEQSQNKKAISGDNLVTYLLYDKENKLINEKKLSVIAKNFDIELDKLKSIKEKTPIFKSNERK